MAENRNQRQFGSVLAVDEYTVLGTKYTKSSPAHGRPTLLRQGRRISNHRKADGLRCSFPMRQQICGTFLNHGDKVMK